MNGELIWAAVRLLVALPLVLGLAYLVLKYGLARRYVAPAGKRRMKLVEQLPLGPKTVLSLVALGGRYYLLAHQDNSVSLVKELAELPEPREPETAGVLELTPRTVAEFDRLRQSGGGAAGPPPGGGEGYGPRFAAIARQVLRAGRAIAAEVAVRAGKGKKGEKEVEG